MEARDMSGVVLIALLLASLLGPSWAEANILCKWLGQCWYESPGFRITVVDKETGQPLEDVHALAVWLNYGLSGTKGPLMALEAVSGPDGVLTFPGWGPLRGSQTGLVLARDPVISLFKPGYKTLLLYNTGPPSKSDTTRIRPFYQNRQSFAMEPFQGTLEQWGEELRLAVFEPEISTASQYDPESIRAVYVCRTRRVKAEVEKLPQHASEVKQLLWALEGGIKLLEKGSR